MSTAANLIVALVALIHVYILVLEMFLWDKPAGMKAFRQTPEQARITKVLAAKRAARSGAATVIACGREAQVLSRLAAGESIGTQLVARTSPLAAKKQWIADHLQLRRYRGRKPGRRRMVAAMQCQRCAAAGNRRLRSIR